MILVRFSLYLIYLGADFTTRELCSEYLYRVEHQSHGRCWCCKFLTSTVPSLAWTVTPSLDIEFTGGKQSFGIIESNLVSLFLKSNQMLKSWKFTRKMEENANEEK